MSEIVREQKEKANARAKKYQALTRRKLELFDELVACLDRAQWFVSNASEKDRPLRTRIDAVLAKVKELSP
jgi:hypothetical protein